MLLEKDEHAWTRGDETAVIIQPLRARDVERASTALPRVSIHGVSFHAINERQCIEHVMDELKLGRGGSVVTPNVDHVRRCSLDRSYSAIVAEAELVVADGMPLIWASRLQGTPLPQRVAGSDLINSLSFEAANHHRSIFLLGGALGTADAAAAILRDRHPQLVVAGTACPQVGFENDEKELQRLAATLKDARPDIVYVALGSPKQERLIAQLRWCLPSAWWLGVGVSFSFLSGDVHRAPMWMRKTGLEWFHRLCQEPRRLFKRYIVVGMPFASMMMAKAAARGVSFRLGGWRSKSPANIVATEKPSITRENHKPRQEPVEEAARRPDSDSNHNGAAKFSSSTVHVSNTPMHARLRGLVLLGGSVRPSPLAASLKRSVLDLPIHANHTTVISHWIEQAAALAAAQGLDRVPTRLLLDGNSPEPLSAGSGDFRVEWDTSEFGGTGGLLARAALDYDDDDAILVANAAQMLMQPLTELYASLRDLGGVISLVAHRDGTPSGLMLVTCRALRLIPKVGFVDMKEQALPVIAAQHDVRVLQCNRSTGLGLRTLGDYVGALRARHRPAGKPDTDDPLAEDWKSAFAIVENGATVAPNARLHDSVILSGATVESGAVVVRSIVGEGSVVLKDSKSVDEFVGSGIGRPKIKRSRPGTQGQTV